MNRSRWTPLLFVFASIMFFIAGFIPRLDDRPMNTTMVVLGLVFMILAVGHYARLRQAPPTVKTDPRLPARKTQKPGP